MKPPLLYIIPVVAFILGAGGGGFLAWTSVIAPKLEELRPPPPPPPPDPKILELPIVPEKGEILEKTAKELEQFHNDLKAKQQALMDIDESLVRRETMLKGERERLDTERSRLETLQKQIEERLIKIADTESTGFQGQADLYNKMKNDEIINLMRISDDRDNIRIMTLMKQAKTAKILETWSKRFPDDRERIARISEQMRLVLQGAATDAPPGVPPAEPATPSP